MGHILNFPWYSRMERRRIRGNATRKAVLSYLDRYVPFVFTSEDSSADGPVKEYIFSIWFQGEENAPDVVQACWNSIRRNCSLELVVLDEKSIFEWIDLPDYVVSKWRSGKMKHAHFADICRIELLYRYGGLWMDATDYVFSDIPQWLMDQDFFVYMSGNSLKGFYSYIQNCFIRSKKKSYLIQVWRNAVLKYWEHEESAVDYFVHQLLFLKVVRSDRRAEENLAAMPSLIQDPTHVLWYEYADKDYDSEVLATLASSAVFHKMEYKSASAVSPRPGSFADVLINPDII
ncbi:MAG: hypothetical protein J6A22_06955 [Bacteroidales bacterium]|nr:hypothetical protein [Bacteroidales bacterium]